MSTDSHASSNKFPRDGCYYIHAHQHRWEVHTTCRCWKYHACEGGFWEEVDRIGLHLRLQPAYDGKDPNVYLQFTPPPGPYRGCEPPPADNSLTYWGAAIHDLGGDPTIDHDEDTFITRHVRHGNVLYHPLPESSGHTSKAGRGVILAFKYSPDGVIKNLTCSADPVIDPPTPAPARRKVPTQKQGLLYGAVLLAGAGVLGGVLRRLLRRD